MVTVVNVAKIDEVLRYLALNDHHRFNAHQVAHLSGHQDVNAVYDYLIQREPYVLKRYFEIMCPNFHSTEVVQDPDDIIFKWIECRVCDKEFIPDVNRIHIVFEFNPEYLRDLQEVDQQEKKSQHPTVLI